MESILVHPENALQLKVVKAVPKALKVPFEDKLPELPVHIISSIHKSLAEFEAGETISLQEFTGRHFTKKQVEYKRLLFKPLLC